MIFKKISNQEELNQELKKIGSEDSGIEIMQPKFEHHIIKIKDICTSAALIIKQEILSKGGEAAIPREMIVNKINKGDVLLSANTSQYLRLCKKLQIQPFGLKQISEDIKKIITNNQLIEIKTDQMYLNFKRTYIMGILNITPDSFSDGGKYINPDQALKKALEMIKQGADIIDIGGQSTRPGAKSVGKEEEIERLLPVLKKIKKEIDIPISIDTFYADVAEECIKKGADIINDISGLKFDPNMAAIVAKYNVPVVIMHIKGTPDNMQNNPIYNDVMDEIITYIKESIDIGIKAGIKKENIIVDPGIGFGKTVDDNYKILRNLEELKILKCPILVGTSRKSMIGKILNLPPEERIEGTIATNVTAILNGANIIRVHDVAELKKAALITDRIRYFNTKEE